MGRVNETVVTEFILLGFPSLAEIQYAMFSVSLMIYLVTLSANSLIIAVIRADHRLHSPMYFFLCNLSLIDIFYSSSNAPKALEGFLVKRNVITFFGCAAQMYCALSLGITQCILLAVMAWDRYVAICKPLNYHMIMSKRTCVQFAVLTWSSGFLLAVVHVSVTLTAPLCGHNQIDYPSCEVTAVLRLACTDIRLREAVIFLMSVAILIIPFAIILLTYSCIIATILRMPSAAGRQRAFSTCGSHVTVVTLFFGTAMAMYMRPRSMISIKSDKILTLFYGAVTPMLNPLIYTLRNKEVKGALTKLLCRKITSNDESVRT
ncbi:olfactory receptor 2D2-like [Ambystoma mexicanum]|uniref:olfactory receptor 2D2-like n=1 Tax=Ambystoma mexicanum TaxID=8296 RepID=UPI0037E7BD8E